MAKVAFLGLGVMGYPMAGHLQKAGHEVTVYNRTTAKAEKWAGEHGGAFKATPREAAEGQDFVMACVGNDDDLRSVCYGDDGAFAGLAKGAIFVDHTTVSAAVTRELHAAAKEFGAGFVDAPVSGGQAGAENGQLGIMCGGDAADYEKALRRSEVYPKPSSAGGTVRATHKMAQPDRPSPLSVQGFRKRCPNFARRPVSTGANVPVTRKGIGLLAE